MRSRRLNLMTMLTLISMTSVAAAQDPGRGVSGNVKEEKWQLEFFVSTLTAASVTEGGFGLRSAYQWKPRLAFEGSLSHVEEVWLPDLSLKLSLRPNKRTDLFLLGGPSLVAIDDFRESLWMFHAGFGAEVPLGQRFFLRPEIRGRWFLDRPDAVTIADISIGFGWRF